jgi:hypothetical protein
MLTLGTLISYSQSVKYPITKKQGPDSVVIITVDQADKINQVFVSQKDSIAEFKRKFDSLSVNFHLYVLGSAKKYDGLMSDYSVRWYENKDLEARYDSAMKAVKRIERRKAKLEAGEFWGMAGYSLLVTIIAGILAH